MRRRLNKSPSQIPYCSKNLIASARTEVDIRTPPSISEIFAKIVGWPGVFLMRISMGEFLLCFLFYTIYL